MTTIDLEVSTHVAAPAELVYDLVADLTRMGEWSPENLGGAWVQGAAGPAVGARFRGRNRRRAPWSTPVVVTEADRGRAFAFACRPVRGHGAHLDRAAGRGRTGALGPMSRYPGLLRG
jgi:hypothetical protein